MFKKLMLLSFVLCAGFIITPQFANAQSFSLNGEGIVWFDGCGEKGCFNKAEKTSFYGDVSLKIDGFAVNWIVTLNIDEFGITEEFEIGQDKGWLALDDSGEFVRMESHNCWGCDCPIDEDRPDECGHNDLGIVLEIDSFSGYLQAGGDSGKEQGHVGWRLIGDLNLSR